MIQVMVVDDSAVVRRLVTRALDAEPDIEVMATAFDGQAAVDKLQRIRPDVLVLDIEMPRLDGLETLSRVRRMHPKLPVVMFSTLTERGATATFDALSRGASDYVAKPVVRGGGIADAERVIREELVPRLRSLSGRDRLGLGTQPVTAPAPAVRPVRTPARPQRLATVPPSVLVIGASTGGPTALGVLLEALPALPVPIAVVQHMPPMFTALFAERLDKRTVHRVSEATDGQPIHAGDVVIAPGGRHLRLQRSGTDLVARLDDGPPENSCRPAVDVLFRSAVEMAGVGCLAVVLTGMGEDGRRGGDHIVEAGGEILVQDEATSVVWGMPGAVARAGLASAELPLDQLAGAITARMQRAGVVAR